MLCLRYAFAIGCIAAPAHADDFDRDTLADLPEYWKK